MILTQNRPKTAKSSWHCSFNLLLGIFENRRETGHAQGRSLKSCVPWRLHNEFCKSSIEHLFRLWLKSRFVYCLQEAVTWMWQDIVNTAGSSYGSWAKLFANVSNIAGNILLTSTLSTTGDQVLLSPKNASKVIFNAREVLRCTDIAKPDILVLLMFMFHLPL